MNNPISLLLIISLLLFSCEKEEQSCSDGIFDPEKEEETDCGGVCPPCNFEPTVIDTYLSTQINGESVSFSDFSLSKTPEWILSFENDSLNIKVNFGKGDSLGGRPIETMYSTATYNEEDFSEFDSGTVVFAEIDDTENLLSGFFTAKFVSSINEYDTLRITGGEFSKISW